jgi:hypothetical protein
LPERNANLRHCHQPTRAGVASYAFFFRLRRVTKVAKVEEAEQFGDATPARVG